jgi:hypothetical protein
MYRSDLSFVRTQDRKPTTHWVKETVSDYTEACAVGRDRADELARYIAATGDQPVLTAILSEIFAGERGGVEAGFLARMASMMSVCTPQTRFARA